MDDDSLAPERTLEDASPSRPTVVKCPSFCDASRAGRVGLDNLGNTCFMSAGLQCLSHLEPVAAFFLSNAYEKDINRRSVLGCKGEFAEAFAELQRTLWQSNKRTHTPSDLRKKLASFAPHIFHGNEQQDLQEFLAFCLDALHEDLNRVQEQPPPTSPAELKEDERVAAERGEEVAGALAWGRHLERSKSFLVDLMQGQLQSSLTCAECGNRSTHFDPFLYLSLPVNWEMTKVTDAIALYLEEETMSGDEQWFCTKCRKKVDAKKKIDLWMLPPILILHLKRLDYNRSSGRLSKIGKLLSCPKTLDLSEYCSTHQSQGAVYDVVCVANHKGKASDGHYSATCYVGDRWYKFDDEEVRACANDDVVNHQAYVIFLVRQSMGGMHDLGHNTPFLRQQSISMPELWPHPVWATQCSSLADALQASTDHSRMTKKRQSSLPEYYGDGKYLMALPDVIHGSPMQGRNRKSAEVSSASLASAQEAQESCCASGIIKLIFCR